MDEKEKQRLINSMFKKAAGYEAVETQEEYSFKLVENRLNGDKKTKKRRT